MGWLKYSAAMIVVSFTAACSAPAGNGNGGGGGGGGGNLDSKSANKAGSGIAQSAESGSRAYKLHTSAGFTGCETTTVISGDTDGDMIPTMSATQYSNCSQQTPYGPAIVSGDETLQDSSGAPGFDFVLAQDLQIQVQDTAGTSVHYNAVHTATSGGAGYQMTEATDVIVTSADADGPFTRHDEIAWLQSYQPAFAWQPGQAPVAGTYAPNGAWQTTLDQGGVITVVEAAVTTVVPLQIDPSCATLIVSGTLQAVVGDGNNQQVMDVSWTGCDAAGTELVPAP